MAKRRKSRVRGTVAETGIKFAGLLVGTVGGNLLQKAVSPDTTKATKTEKILYPLAEAAAGFGLAHFSKGFLEYVGLGVAVDGSTKTISAAGMNGVKGLPVSRRQTGIGNPDGKGQIDTSFEVV